jgi:hypothetical protein
VVCIALRVVWLSDGWSDGWSDGKTNASTVVEVEIAMLVMMTRWRW